MRLMKKLYEDYLKKDRLSDYARMLQAFHNARYRMVGILGFYNMINRQEEFDKVLINRHDIDTSPKIARELFEIEKKIYGHDGSATYYFRNSTIDKHLITDIDEFGYETAYHYEEIATLIKRNKRIADLKDLLPDSRELFIKNLQQFRNKTGSPSLSVASHGDFINVKYRFPNYELLADHEIRKKAGIMVEAYDSYIMQFVESRYADQELLSSFADEVIKGIINGNRVIMTLTHPRNWKVDIVANTKENIIRFWQGLIFGLNKVSNHLDS